MIWTCRQSRTSVNYCKILLPCCSFVFLCNYYYAMTWPVCLFQWKFSSQYECRKCKFYRIWWDKTCEFKYSKFSSWYGSRNCKLCWIRGDTLCELKNPTILWLEIGLFSHFISLERNCLVFGQILSLLNPKFIWWSVRNSRSAKICYCIIKY